MPAPRLSSMKRLVPGAIACTLVLAGLLSPAQAATSPQAAARSLATAAVSGVRLPAGAIKLTQRPTADIGPVPTPNDYPTSVVMARWYSAPGPLATTIARIKARPPDGWLLQEDTETGAPQVLVFVPVTSGLSTLVVTAAGHGSRVDVGVVADVVWLPLRTPLETLPHATSATVTYTGPVPAGYQGPDVKRAHEHLTLHGAQATALATALNHAPVTLPYTGTVVCPPDFGERVAATFAYGNHHVTFAIATAGCPSIGVRADGVLQPALDPNLGVYRALTTLLHRTIPWTQR